MLVKIKPQKRYFNLTHTEGDWDGDVDPSDPRCKINGSAFMTAPQIGTVIKSLVAHARQFGCGDYEYVDLSRDHDDDADL